MTRSTNILLAAAALTATSAFAQQKTVTTNRMTALWQRAIAAKTAGDVATFNRLSAQYDALSATLGGDQPGKSVVATGGAQYLVAPAGPCGSPSTTYAAVIGTTGPIADVSTQTFTATVAGVVLPLWDIDLNVAITHTYAADLDISLTSPLGTVCDVTSDNGAYFNDVFNGTLFDDQSLNSVVSYAYVDLVAAPDLRPEVSMNSTFIGENPNGVWTLTIVDDANVDVGNLSAFSLTVTDGTVVPPPPPPTGFNAPVTFTQSPAMVIADVTTQSDVMAVSGLGTRCWDVKLYTEITHTWNSDIEITLTSPAGDTAIVSDNRGGANDDVFNGTLFDMASVNPIATYVFTSGVAAPDLQPDGNFDNFRGVGCGVGDPNGNWTLTIADQVGGDVGLLTRWDLTIVTALSGCSSATTNYCTSSTTTNGCNPIMGASALNASIAAGPGSFVLSATQVEGTQSGVMFYGINGRAAVVWGAGSTSFLCVKAPLVRGPVSNAGGTFAACDGVLSLDFFAFMAANPSVPGNPLTAGQMFDAQAWFRDPPAPKTTNLSDGIEWTLCP